MSLPPEPLSAEPTPLPTGPARARLRTRLSGLGLASKLMGIGGLFLVLALASVGLTLWVTWQLEGGAAAVNEAGRMRMQSYRLALRLQTPVPETGRAELNQQVQGQLQDFDASLSLLRDGDPARPLAVPWDQETRGHFELVQRRWQPLRELARELANQRPGPGLSLQVDDFVHEVDSFVSAIELHLAQWTTLLRTLQLVMMSLALLSALVLLYVGHVLVLDPVRRLQRSLGRIEQGDFGTRVQVASHDELGALAEGFNRMAERLQDLYSGLEGKVREKTARLQLEQLRLRTLYETATFVAQADTLQALAQGFSRQLRSIAGADAVAIRWSDEATQRYVLLASDCLPKVMVEEEHCVLTGDCLCGATSAGAIAQPLKVIPILDATRQPPVDKTGQQVQQHCERAGFRTLVTVSLTWHQRVLGEIELFYRHDTALSVEESSLFEALASHLAGAMENLRSAALARESAVADERQMLARELHDSIAQSLAFLKIQMQLLRSAMSDSRPAAIEAALNELDAGIRESYSDVRELLLHFRTNTHAEDMEPALRETLSKFELQAGLRPSLAIHGEGLPIAPDVQVQVLHIVQEALSNIRKHAHARQVELRVDTHPQWQVTIRDDGLGFDARGGPPDGTHVGLRIMRERAERIGAELSLESGPQGTCVTLRLPQNPPTPAAPTSEATAP